MLHHTLLARYSSQQVESDVLCCAVLALSLPKLAVLRLYPRQPERLEQLSVSSLWCSITAQTRTDTHTRKRDRSQRTQHCQHMPHVWGTARDSQGIMIMIMQRRVFLLPLGSNEDRLALLLRHWVHWALRTHMHTHTHARAHTHTHMHTYRLPTARSPDLSNGIGHDMTWHDIGIQIVVLSVFFP